jgi:hypothetical protein
MTTFTLSRDHDDADDLSRDLAQFRRALARGDRLNVDIETKRTADSIMGRRIQALADTKEIGWDEAVTLYFGRASASNSDDATLIAISAAGVLTMIGHPSAGGRA